ncbi:hypothetical protein BDV96DRAFT_573596 [Lophiotrema nucula]|uniref:Uncharacterized protein n=1 Tax=Lophiotrema nucula TaxID=690887 RepID=A0A6A5ZBE0_9PLEO|nr:hypothetical protein BDV96DRAFT_573596 [Lophiotrema nucula]
MAACARAAMLSDDLDSSHPESSPDPLAASLRINNSRPRRKSTRPTKEPLADSSPNKQGRRMSITEQLLDLSSPSKSMIMNTGRPGGASPWKIKVTVEAEPGSGSDGENMQSPTVKRVTRTKTTTVPLKDADASSPVKRRGRPRKSEGVKPKRSGTPVRRRSKSKAKATDVDSTEHNAAESSTDVPPKKKRGRPRKSIQLAVEDDGTVADFDTEASRVDNTVADDFVSIEPEADVPEAQEPIATPAIARERRTPATVTFAEPNESPSKEPHTSTPSRDDTSRKIARRKNTPAAKGKIVFEDSSDDEVEAPTPTTSADERSKSPIHVPSKERLQQEVNFIEATADIPNHMSDDDDDDDFRDVTHFAFDEGVTRGPEDTTILDSENFSMVSVDSLPSGGGLSSPALDIARHAPAFARSGPSLDNSYLNIPSRASRATRSSPLPSPRITPPPSETTTTSQPQASSPASRQREVTPVNYERSPSNPPAIEPGLSCHSTASTPKLARVVKAGVELQGVLDPVRITPTALSPEEALVEQRDRLDDLFRGFSEGTRRELQAGLRLGEQLARQNHERRSRESTPALSSPCKVAASRKQTDDVFSSQAKQRNSRLLTPEDQDYVLAPPPPSTQEIEVRYPSLQALEEESQLMSPAGSVDEMSWRADTPPPVRAESSGAQQLSFANVERNNVLSRAGSFVAPEPAQHGYGDIWQEEASRSPGSEDDNGGAGAQQPEKTPQLQDLFADDGQPIKPARAKIPKSWRRRSSSDFNYSDEAEIPEDTPSSTESDEPKASALEKGKGKVLEPVIPEEVYEEDDASVASDDTGMFFQSNLPNVFRNRTREARRRMTADHVDLTQLIEEGGSILPESSPVVRTPAKPDPFRDTPPQIALVQAAPFRSSPLRQELRASDSDNSYQQFDESLLPQSSPFRTQVDDTIASDEQQLYNEMEVTNSSLRRVREEADAHAYAYQPQDRTLGDITELTENSRSHLSTMMLPSSPPQMLEDSILAPKKHYPSLFGEGAMSKPSPAKLFVKPSPLKPIVSKPAIAITPPVEEEPQEPLVKEAYSRPQRPGLISRLSSTLWNAIGTPAPPPQHPAIADFDHLPNVEPWTKTHYKALDQLYQAHKKQPTLFAPSSSPNSTNTNNDLLARFLQTNNHPFVGAKLSSWGYSVTMTKPLVVLCAVFTQLLTLKDIAEYERVTGKSIQLGDCGPGPAGTAIEGLEVVQRLATIIMGAELRKDEKKGKVVERVGGMEVQWPR